MSVYDFTMIKNPFNQKCEPEALQKEFNELPEDKKKKVMIMIKNIRDFVTINVVAEVFNKYRQIGLHLEVFKTGSAMSIVYHSFSNEMIRYLFKDKPKLTPGAELNRAFQLSYLNDEGFVMLSDMPVEENVEPMAEIK